MKPVVVAFGLGLSVGLGITVVRVVRRARAGLPTAWGVETPERAQGQGGPGDPLASLGERIVSAFEQGAKAMRETEAELRSKVLDGGA